MELVKLKDLVEQPISGEWGDEPEENDINSVKIIRTTNFTNKGNLDLKKEVVKRKINELKLEKKKLKYGDIIIEKSGGSPTQPVGRVVYFDVKDDVYLCNNFTAILRSSKKISINSRYLFYYLFLQHTSEKTLKFQNKTTGIINLKLSDYINSIKVPVPDINIQRKIANVLDQAQSLINKRKSQIEDLDKFIQSVFLEMFGDPVINSKKFVFKRLLDLTDKITDGTHHSPPMVEHGVPYITAKHLKFGGLDFFSNPTYISVEDHEKIYQRCNPVEGDVIYIKDGATTGIAGVNKYEFEFSMLSSLALIKNDKSQINNYYLVHYLNNSRVKEKIIGDMVGGAIKRLTLARINNISVLVPSIDIQNQFAQIVQKTEQQKDLLQQSLTQLEDYFNSLMQRAFKGELFS